MVPGARRAVVARSEGGWRPVFAPSPVPFSGALPTPQALSEREIARIVSAFADAARRAREAGAKILEIHSAHGYLLHEFLSPMSNLRSDRYGGSFDNRTRALREVAEAVRDAWPEGLPLFVRISATDWVEGGWNIDDSVALAAQLKPLGVDLIDCSSGGAVPNAVIPAAPGFQVPFAERIRKETGILTAAVGMITEPEQAQRIIQTEQADMVFLARELLREPYWPLHAARKLHQDIAWPKQYLRARPS